MPKIDLHCHLDGSLSAHTIRELAKNADIALPEDLPGLMSQITVPQSCTSLSEYLSRFKLPIACLQSAENLFTASHNLLADASKENVVYMEVRFAPTLSMREKLSLDVVIDSVLQGLEAGRRQFGVAYGVILCALRNHAYEDNAQVLSAAVRYGDQGVVALDLAGDENRFPTHKYRALFKEAASKGLPFTIHAGEADGPASVRAALSFGAKRIGHGISIKNDTDLMEFCFENNIGIELCPVSNLQTKAAASWEDYPLLTFLNRGLPVTVNTDNRTVSNTTLTREFGELDAYYDLDTKDLETLFRNAVNVSFSDYRHKQRLHKTFDDFKAKTQTTNW